MQNTFTCTKYQSLPLDNTHDAEIQTQPSIISMGVSTCIKGHIWFRSIKFVFLLLLRHIKQSKYIYYILFKKIISLHIHMFYKYNRLSTVRTQAVAAFIFLLTGKDGLIQVISGRGTFLLSVESERKERE